MEVEFRRPDDPDVVATARWTAGSVQIESDDASVADALARAFRRIPVVVDDAAYRSLGTTGEVLVQPGDLEWFRAVAQVRVPAETGLLPRFVPGALRSGYDPAAGYRSFEESIERLDGTA